MAKYFVDFPLNWNGSRIRNSKARCYGAESCSFVVKNKISVVTNSA